MITKRTFDIVKQEDKKNFLIKVYLEDELTPEEMIKKLEESDKASEALDKDLASIPEIITVRTKTLSEQKKLIDEELAKFMEFEGIAKVWVKENEFLKERTPTPDMV